MIVVFANKSKVQQGMKQSNADNNEAKLSKCLEKRFNLQPSIYSAQLEKYNTKHIYNTFSISYLQNEIFRVAVLSVDQRFWEVLKIYLWQFFFCPRDCHQNISVFFLCSEYKCMSRCQLDIMLNINILLYSMELFINIKLYLFVFPLTLEPWQFLIAYVFPFFFWLIWYFVCHKHLYISLYMKHITLNLTWYWYWCNTSGSPQKSPTQYMITWSYFGHKGIPEIIVFRT